MLGTIGDVLLLLAFAACGVSAFAFFWSARADGGSPVARAWKRTGRWAWGAMSGAVMAVSGILWYLILTHQYQYAYVYQNSSNDLPWHYLFSTFWAGQEGSFLLWILMMCGVGIALIGYVQREYERHVMAVVGLSQFFLLSMIVGLQLGPVEIGASPFVGLAEKFPDAPIFQQNPGFVPADGQGLNDLLQNPWMTIHPPFLFVGFSSMVVPFAFAVAALWRKKYTQWVRPALPWTLFAVAIMGVAITMGGYWAYVTLSFGGYWAWDPVENSSLVPWIVGVAAFHTMLVQKKSSAGNKASLLLCIASYLLVIYSTFLTRSGILGDVSVHSFVDLGLYNQLLLWIGVIGTLGVGLFVYRFNELPTPDKEPRVLSREFMILSGATLLTTTAAVIILGTSAPIFGRIFRDNPSAVPIEFYNEWTLPLAIGFVFLAGLGQLFWWNKMDVESLNRVLLKPVAFATVSTIGILLLTPFAEQTILLPASAPATQTASAGLVSGLSEFWAMYGQALQLLLLLFVGFFALFGNGMVLWRVMRGLRRHHHVRSHAHLRPHLPRQPLGRPHRILQRVDASPGAGLRLPRRPRAALLVEQDGRGEPEPRAREAGGVCDDLHDRHPHLHPLCRADGAPARRRDRSDADRLRRTVQQPLPVLGHVRTGAADADAALRRLLCPLREWHGPVAHPARQPAHGGRRHRPRRPCHHDPRHHRVERLRPRPAPDRHHALGE